MARGIFSLFLSSPDFFLSIFLSAGVQLFNSRKIRQSESQIDIVTFIDIVAFSLLLHHTLLTFSHGLAPPLLTCIQLQLHQSPGVDCTLLGVASELQLN